MQTLPSDFQACFTNLGRKCTLTNFFHAIYLSKPLRPVNFNARIVLGSKSAKVWILNSLGKLWMRLVDTELEALAYTFLGNPSFIPVSLKLVPISRRAIRITLSYLPRTALKSISASMIWYLPESAKSFGHGVRKQDLESQPY